MHKAFDWKRSTISRLDVEAVPQSCTLYVQTGLSLVWYMWSVWRVERFDLRPSNQYRVVRVTPSCFRFAEMCLCQVSLLSRCSPRYLTSREELPIVHIVVMVWRGPTWIRWLSFSIFETNFGLQLSWFVVCIKQWLDHCPWLVLQYLRQRFLL
jgi:hypothetical protein